MHEPRVKSMEYNSPGHIELELLDDAAKKLGDIALTCLKNRDDIDERVKDLVKFLRANKLSGFSDLQDVSFLEDGIILSPDKKAKLTSLSSDLSSALGLGEYDNLMNYLTMDDPVIHAKVLLSFERRIHPLIDYMNEGMLNL